MGHIISKKKPKTVTQSKKNINICDGNIILKAINHFLI